LFLVKEVSYVVPQISPLKTQCI